MATLLDPKRYFQGMAVVCWKWKIPQPDNVNSGRGQPIGRSAAESFVKNLNQEYPRIEHWIEPVKYGSQVK